MVIRKELWCLAIAVLAMTAAAEPRVRAYLDRPTVSLRQPFLLTVEVSGENIGQVKLPDVEGLNINKQAGQRQSSTQVEISGLSTSVIKTQQVGYYVQATRTGKFTVPPITVEVDGKVLSTDPILLTVTDSPQPSRGSATPAMPAPSAANPAQNVEQLSWNDVVFVESRADKTEVYQGAPLLLTLCLGKISLPGMQIGPTRSQEIHYPATEGFYATTTEPGATVENRNGKNYEVTQFHRMLYPTATGDLKIEAWRWEGIAAYGFQQQAFRLETPPIDVRVKPLPDRPEGFSGAVGHFTIKAVLMRDEVIQGAPTQLVVRINGQGNPNAIAAPVVPKIPNAYVSDPDKQVAPTGDPSGVNVEKTFTYNITPLEAGSLAVPAIPFCYFDPDQGAYQTETTEPFAVRVLASAERAQVLVTREERPREGSRVDVIGEDICPPVTDAGTLRPAPGWGTAIPGVVVVPVLAYGGVAVLMRRKRRFEHDTGFARDYFAKSKGRKRLRNVASATEPSEGLYRAVVGYIADKFNVPEAGLTASDITPLFESQGLGPEYAENFIKILRACDRAHYASARLSEDEIHALTEAAIASIDQTDRLLKRGRRK